MATNTTYMNLIKPELTDVADIASINTNMDTIDAKLGLIEAGAEVNVNADWNAASGDAQILNKPTIPTVPSFTATATDIKMNGTQAVGSEATVARADHVHPSDTSRASLTGTETLTNKRITKRVTTETSNATPTPNVANCDIHTITALAAAAEFGSPTGTPTEGQSLILRIKDNGTARALTWNAVYRAVGVTLPTTTVISKTLYVGFIYNNTDTKWDCLAVGQEA